MLLRELFDQQTDEMIGVKKYQNFSADQATKIIARDFGLERIKSDSIFGTVLITKDPNIVIKVFERDDAYLRFIDFVQKHPNKHYPKIIKAPKLMTAFYKRYEMQNPKFVIMAMERLYPIKSHNFLQFAVAVANARDLYDKPQYLPNGTDNSGGNIDDDDYDAPSYTFQELARDYPWIPSLWEAAHQVFRLVPGNHDLHGGNIMARQDGTIVIIDPLTDDESYEYVKRVQNMPHTAPMVSGPHYRLNK